jgi:nucleotide-binding universal stress UspA family protein
MGRIVVGVDGSENANRALEWAVDEAKYRAATLHLIHSWKFPPAMPLPDGGIAPADIEGVANAILGEAKALIPADVSVETEVANEFAARALIRASEGADLVVVGARGMGGFKGLLLGSVSQQVAHHARCPIVIVPHDRES